MVDTGQKNGGKPTIYYVMLNIRFVIVLLKCS